VFERRKETLSMGVLYAIHALDPKKIEDARSFAVPDTLRSVDALIEVSRSLGLEPSPESIEFFEPDQPGHIAELFLEYATIKSWDLDKALADFALGPVFDGVPELRELHPIKYGSLNHHTLAMSLPKWAHAQFGEGGLSNVWPVGVVETWLPVVQRFATPASVAECQFPKPGLLRSIFAKPGAQQRVLQQWQSEYAWANWLLYIESIRFCCAERACWGLCFYP
jgi:hypothetical protein